MKGVEYDVDVDFLSGKHGGEEGSISKHVDGIKALPATGGNFAFDFPPTDVYIEFVRADGALDSGHVNVISMVPYFVMKAAALGRGKPKDAYDIYHIIKYYDGGIRQLAEAFIPYKEHKLVQDMCRKLREKFASEAHSSPVDVADFLDISDKEEAERIRQDAYQKIQYFVRTLSVTL